MNIIVNSSNKAYKNPSGKVLNGVAQSIETSALSVTANGTYTAPTGTAYNHVAVSVPNPSTGKVSITNTNEVDVTNYATAQVVDANLVADNIAEGVSILGIVGTSVTGIQACIKSAYVTATSLTATDVKLSVKKTGKYKVSWVGCRNTSSGCSSMLYIAGTAYGTENTTFTSTYFQHNELTGVSLTAGQEIVVRAKSRSSSYRMFVANLIIESED